MGIMARADVNSAGPVHLRHKTGLHPVKLRVIHTVLEPEAHECAVDDLDDQSVRPLIERKLCGRARDKIQAAQLDKAHNVVTNRRLIGVFLKSPEDITEKRLQ